MNQRARNFVAGSLALSFSVFTAFSCVSGIARYFGTSGGSVVRHSPDPTVLPYYDPTVSPHNEEPSQLENDNDRYSGSYSSCSEVRRDGRGPLRRGQRGYSLDLDSDGDGVACEGRGQ